MTVEDVLAAYDLEKSILIGYYGGGNYGDELLLEVLANRLKSHGIEHAAITYQNPALYPIYHHDFGFPVVEMNSKPLLLKEIFRSKNVIVGGGGLWGLDVNPNILLLSILLFFSRWVLGKKIFLLGVGYYDSTSRLGKISAWLAGKAATYIVSRDQETYNNFQKISKHVGLDSDIAWLIPKLDLTPYAQEVAQLDTQFPIRRKTLFITLRRFRAQQKNSYVNEIRDYLAEDSNRDVIVALMEPRSIDEAGYKLIKSWQKKHQNIWVADFSCNPLALYLFFQKHHDKLAFIGPQFHMIITAYLNHVPFLPIAYDNKVTALFKQIGQAKVLPIQSLNNNEIQMFAQEFYGGT